MAKKVAIVFSGGGTKGVYSAGVTNATLQVGLRPDVITGSSIGAINTVLLAEMLLTDNQEEMLANYLIFWEKLALDSQGKQKILSSDRFSPLVLSVATGLTVLALSHVGLTIHWFNKVLAFLNLALASSIIYKWYAPPKRVIADNHSIVKGLARIFDTITLRKFAKGLFTNEGLKSMLLQMGVPEHRTFKNYYEQKLHVACTRTNLRTGKKEISEYLPPNHKKNCNGRIVGNPYVIPAVLASAAYPMALPPVDAASLYNPKEKDNEELFKIMEVRNQVKTIFSKHFTALHRNNEQMDDNEEYRIFMEQLGLWELRRLEDTLNQTTECSFDQYVEGSMLQFLDYYIHKRKAALTSMEMNQLGQQAFVRLRTELVPLLPSIWQYRDYPRCGQREAEYSDSYIDGGVVDNTPLSLALAKFKDLGVAQALVFVVFLNPPRLDFWSQTETEEARALEIGHRGLSLSEGTNMINDIKSVARINALLRRSNLGEVVLKQINKIDLKVKSIFPEEKASWLFAVDERFGYNQQRQRKIITTGCKNTLEAFLQVEHMLPDHVQQRMKEIIKGDGIIRQCHNTQCLYYPQPGRADYSCDGKIFFGN